MGRIFTRMVYIIVGVLFSFVTILFIIGTFIESDYLENETEIKQQKKIAPPKNVVKIKQIGSASVYAGIEAINNCKALQVSFNTSMDNHDASSNRNGPTHPITKASLSYAKFADERMRKIGCY